MNKPTLPPYKIVKTSQPNQVLLVGGEGRPGDGFSIQMDKPTGEFIMKACNSYNTMTAALKILKEDMRMLRDGEWDGSAKGCEDSINIADAALEEAGIK